MRLTDRLHTERSFKSVLGLVLALLFLAAVALPARALARFYGHLEDLNDTIRRGDFQGAEAGLREVTAFYERSRRWGLQWVTDPYLFRDAFIQQAAYKYLIGDYEAVVRDLADKIEDARASHLLASARFQLARRQYRAIAPDDPGGEGRKAAIIQQVLDEVSADYERALRRDTGDRFDLKWNYDLTSDADATRRALEVPKAVEPPELEPMRGEGPPVRRRRG
jgi:hypothetical protein